MFVCVYGARGARGLVGGEGRSDRQQSWVRPDCGSADRWPCEIRGSGSKQSHALMSAELEGTPLQEADSPGRGARPALLGVPKHGMSAADQQASRASRSMSLRPTIPAAPITRTCMRVLLIKRGSCAYLPRRPCNGFVTLTRPIPARQKSRIIAN